ncbi:hypothetical protein DdX_09303 [Ditylenchus destructor]|uniref:Uncharacterized protein n=1 Tax=Ditylenchus destructor TaxID=166010 RepID=A0AAD4R6K2_9BILA|nr:hypothetical protein DdX_09303 [Ditylenchus destructor]
MFQKIFGASNSNATPNRQSRPIPLANAAVPRNFDVLFELVIKKAATSSSAENPQNDIQFNRKFEINVSELNETTFENVLKIADRKSSFLKFESCEVWREQFHEYVDYTGQPVVNGAKYRLTYSQKVNPWTEEAFANLKKELKELPIPPEPQEPNLSQPILKSIFNEPPPPLPKPVPVKSNDSNDKSIKSEPKVFTNHSAYNPPKLKVVQNQGTSRMQKCTSVNALNNIPKNVQNVSHEQAKKTVVQNASSARIHVLSGPEISQEIIYIHLPDPFYKENDKPLAFPKFPEWQKKWLKTFVRINVPDNQCSWLMSSRILDRSEWEGIQAQIDTSNIDFSKFARHKFEGTHRMLEVCVKYIPPKTAKSKKCRVMNAFVELVVSQYNQNGQQLSCGKFHTFATDAPLCFYLESEIILERSNGFFSPTNMITLKANIGYEQDNFNNLHKF